MVKNLPSKAGYVGSIPGQGRDPTCMPQLRVCMPQLRSALAATKTRCNQNFFKKIKFINSSLTASVSLGFFISNMDSSLLFVV